MFDHVVYKFAVVEVAQQDSVVVADEVSFFGFFLHSIAVGRGEQIFNYFTSIAQILVGEIKVL